MYRQEAQEEYAQALRLGQREHKLALAEGRPAHPEVLDTLLEDNPTNAVQELGVVEIPADKIVGVRSAGRVAAFSPSFLPLLSDNSEFARKWINLCEAHLSSGIRDPITCYEYLGCFYVQEGNKRVSVLRYLGAPRIPAVVHRVLPKLSEEPRIQAYYEFLDFYKSAGIYQIQFQKPGDYAQLLACLGKDPTDIWTERERRTFSAYYQYFCNAFFDLGGKQLALLPEEALLIWLKVYSFGDLGKFSDKELKKTIAALWEDLTALSLPTPVQVRTEPVETGARPGMLTRFVTGTPDHVNVAFVHSLDPEISSWIQAHDLGRKYLEEVLEGRVTVRSYFHADSLAQAEALLEQAVAEGADLVFTTTPVLSRVTLRMAVKYPKVRFLNCSVDTPYSSIRTYYGRIYEAKFITGAIAGAMADDDSIGYVGLSPIFGEPASINAFALGAQLTNPRAKIVLRWSCQKGNHQQDFLNNNIWVISNRDVPEQERMHLNLCNYGTYMRDENGKMQALASPVLVWGRLYEKVVLSILAGTWEKDKDSPRAVNYWWGMNSGVIDVQLAQDLPEGPKAMAKLLCYGLKTGQIDPFRRKIVAQDGTVKNDGSRSFSPEELLHMDWLCENVVGKIPAFEEIEAYAQPMVRALGIYRESIPVEKEDAQ